MHITPALTLCKHATDGFAKRQACFLAEALSLRNNSHPQRQDWRPVDLHRLILV